MLLIGGAVCCTALLISSTSFAANAQITDTTGTITDAGDGPGIGIKLSPGVNLGYTLVNDGTSFAITTANTNVKFDAGTGAIQTRNEYGVASDYPGYYMRPANAAVLATPTAADSGAFGTGWTAQ